MQLPYEIFGLESFKQQEYALLANARCLTEGINIPSVDCVAFLSPKHSKIDIIQAIGRAMRKDPKNKNKHYGYVMLPIFVEVPHGETEEQAVIETNFATIWDVLCSLKEFDPVLAKAFNDISQAQGANINIDVVDRLKNHIDFIAPETLSISALKEKISVTIADKFISAWHVHYGQLQEYQQKHGDCNVPKRFDENVQLGAWVLMQRQHYKKEKLDSKRIELLETLGFNWNPYESNWKEQYQALKAYKNEHGDCYVPQKCSENKLLATWVGGQRTAYRKKKLSSEKIKLLNKLGFVWDQFDAAWKKKYQELQNYKQEHGDCNVPRHWRENEKLGSWINVQRQNHKKGKLEQDKISLLNELGFNWWPEKSSWGKQYQELQAYKQEHGDCLVPQQWSENKLLASWVGGQRTAYRKKKLSSEKIKLLNKLGFVWGFKKKVITT